MDKTTFCEGVEKRLKAAEERIAFFERTTMSWKQEEQDWETTNATLRAQIARLKAELYATQCQGCAGQEMPYRPALFCAHCGEPVARVMPEGEC